MKPIDQMTLPELADALQKYEFDMLNEQVASRLRAIHDLTQAQAKREAELIEQFRHIAEASPQKWEMSRSEFELEFPLWARHCAKHIITPPEDK